MTALMLKNTFLRFIEQVIIIFVIDNVFVDICLFLF